MSRIHYLRHHPHRRQLTAPRRCPALTAAARRLALAARSRRVWRAVGLAAVHTGTVLLILSVPVAAFADAGGPVVLAANSLPVVINNLRDWLMGILAAVATLFLVLAGVYWATAGGDPTQIDKAKGSLRNALVGYGLAVLAPVFLQIVHGIVGG